MARRNPSQALGEQAKDFTIQPHHEEQQPRDQLREHQQNSRIGLRRRIHGRCVGVPCLQPQDLRRQHERLEHDRDRHPDRHANRPFRERPPDQPTGRQPAGVDRRPLPVQRQREAQRERGPHHVRRRLQPRQRHEHQRPRDPRQHQ
jgi:hypothetical protein